MEGERTAALFPYLCPIIARAVDYFVEQREFLRDRIGEFASSDELCPMYVYIYNNVQ